MATTAMAGMAASVAVVGSGAPAGAQTTSEACTFTAVAGSTTVLPTQISVSGTAPGSTTVTVYLNGANAKTTTSAVSPAANAPWGPVTYDITTPVTHNITVQLPGAYGSAFCLGPNNTTVVPIVVGGAAASLPRTGSDTESYVLAALAVIGVGLVLLVNARRRRTVHSQV